MTSVQRRVAIAMLTVLVGLPALGTACAFLCSPGSGQAASAHHGSATTCEEWAGPAEAQLQGLGDHDCGPHAAAQVLATATAIRADSGVGVAPLGVIDALLPFTARPGFAPGFSTPLRYTPAPLPVPTLVLRV